ncbi:hypothetical protein SK128_014687 [Halocaridina rubra]|uniref:Uncharacterized protein n=1 Tax=Halocaridina rubra TaxID=373956 RepID=A0AAN8XRV8_HALRR
MQKWLRKNSSLVGLGSTTLRFCNANSSDLMFEHILHNMGSNSIKLRTGTLVSQ